MSESVEPPSGCLIILSVIKICLIWQNVQIACSKKLKIVPYILCRRQGDFSQRKDEDAASSGGEDSKTLVFESHHLNKVNAPKVGFWNPTKETLIAKQIYLVGRWLR